MYSSICLACQKEFELGDSLILTFEAPIAKPLRPMIPEISGIVDSKKSPGFLWAHEDSGNPPNLIQIDHDGNVTSTIPLKGAINRDWEDIALAGGQLYIADIGDNALAYNEYRIYQFAEPSSNIESIENYKTIRFNYPDGAHDAEALLVDPIKKDVYIITKRDTLSKIYKLSYPQSYTGLNTAKYVGELRVSGVVSATLSYDAKNIIIKTYTGLHLYQRNNQDEISKTLAGSYTSLDYQLEPQGEAIAFANDDSGFYTLSEKGLSNTVNLYFYRKK